jgi:predicted thioesterase
MLPGLEVGATHVEVERLNEITGASPSLPGDGIWVLVMAIEHAARRWMSTFMEPGEQSVGASVEATRLATPSTSATLASTATLTAIRGRRYVFDVIVADESGRLLARGRNERAVVAVPA